MAPRFSLDDVERILAAVGNQSRAMGGGPPAMVPRPGIPRIAPIARKVGWTLYVRGGQFVFWSGLAACLIMLAYWSVPAALHLAK